MTAESFDIEPLPVNEPERLRLLDELAKVLRLLPLMPLSIAWKSLVLLWLWRWFVVPLGVINITYWHSVGLQLLLGFCRNGVSQRGSSKNSSPDDLKQQFFVENGITALIFGFGWLVHLAMNYA